MTAAPAAPMTWHPGPGADARAAMTLLLDLIVPASGDGRMPAAGQAGPLPGALAAGSGVGLPQVIDDLQRASQALFGCGLAALDDDQRRRLLDDWRAREPQTAQQLTLEVLAWYYQQDRVLEAIGLEARPPFPKGHVVEAGDWSLLQPVIGRGRVFRDVP